MKQRVCEECIVAVEDEVGDLDDAPAWQVEYFARTYGWKVADKHTCQVTFNANIDCVCSCLTRKKRKAIKRRLREKQQRIAVI